MHSQQHIGSLQNNERLLKLYESGLPVWAIFLPTYGLYYRPWMRRLTWILFIAVSVFSMACGFYDLYKNVPHVDKVSSLTAHASYCADCKCYLMISMAPSACASVFDDDIWVLSIDNAILLKTAHCMTSCGLTACHHSCLFGST